MCIYIIYKHINRHSPAIVSLGQGTTAANSGLGAQQAEAAAEAGKHILRTLPCWQMLAQTHSVQRYLATPCAQILGATLHSKQRFSRWPCFAHIFGVYFRLPRSAAGSVLGGLPRFLISLGGVRGVATVASILVFSTLFRVLECLDYFEHKNTPRPLRGQLQQSRNYRYCSGGLN